MRAFTLVETLVATFVLALLAIFVTGVFPQLHRGVELTRGHSQAAHLGRTLLEVARRTEYAKLASWRGSSSVAGEVAGRSSGLEFTYSVDVVELEPGLKQVGADVQWRTSSGVKRVDLQTELVDPALTPAASPGATPEPSSPSQGTGGSPGPVGSPSGGNGTGGTPGGGHGNPGNHNGNGTGNANGNGTGGHPGSGGPGGGAGLVNPTLPNTPFQWHDNGHHYGNPNKPDQHIHGGTT